MNTELHIDPTKGRWAKHLPQSLQERYSASQDDPELLSLRDEIALLDTRLSMLLELLDTGEAGGVWKELKALTSKYQKSVKQFRGAPPAEITSEFIAEVTPLIQRGASDTEAWGEIRSVIAERKKATESERRRLIEMQQMITLQEATALQRAIFDIIKSEINDTNVLRSIATKIKAISLIGSS